MNDAGPARGRRRRSLAGLGARRTARRGSAGRDRSDERVLTGAGEARVAPEVGPDRPGLAVVVDRGALVVADERAGEEGVRIGRPRADPDLAGPGGPAVGGGLEGPVEADVGRREDRDGPVGRIAELG